MSVLSPRIVPRGGSRWKRPVQSEAILRHRDGVVGALALPDGRILSWSSDKTLRLWRADGTPDGVLRGHESWVHGALVLPDGRILSWSNDGTLRLWRADGTPDGVLRGHGSYVDGALALPAGRILSWGWDKTLLLWRADGMPDGVLRGHEDRVSGALVLADGRILSWSQDKTLRLWRANGTPDSVPRGQEAAADTAPVATGETDSGLKVRDTMVRAGSSEYRLLRTIPLDAPIVLCNEKIVVTARDRRLVVYDLHLD